MRDRGKKGRGGREARALAVQAYLQAMMPRLAGCSKVVSTVSQLVRDLQAGDVRAQQELAAQTAALRALGEEMAGLDEAPGDLREAHRSIMDASTDLQAALEYLTRNVAGQAPGSLAQVAGLIGQASERLGESAQKMAAYLSQIR